MKNNCERHVININQSIDIRFARVKNITVVLCELEKMHQDAICTWLVPLVIGCHVPLDQESVIHRLMCIPDICHFFYTSKIFGE